MNKKTNKHTNSARGISGILLITFSLATISLTTGISGDNCGAGCGHNHGNSDSGNTSKADLARTLANIGGRLEMVEDRMIGSSEVTALPVEAVIAENGRTYILVQSDQDPAKIVTREVTLGKSNGTYIEAKTGVFPGDNVVIRPEQRTVQQPGYRSQPQFGQVPAPQYADPPQYGQAPTPQYVDPPQHGRIPAPQYVNPPQYGQVPVPQFADPPQYNSSRQYEKRSQYDTQPFRLAPPSPQPYSEPSFPYGAPGACCENEGGSRFIEGPSRCDFDTGFHGGYNPVESGCMSHCQPAGRCAESRCALDYCQEPYSAPYHPVPVDQSSHGFAPEFYRGPVLQYRSQYTPRVTQPTHRHHGSCNH